MSEKISIKVFNWGPCVVKCQIKPEYAKILLDESKANNIDFRDKLAGQIEDETSYSDEARNRMVPFLAKYYDTVALNIVAGLDPAAHVTIPLTAYWLDAMSITST